jgi:Spy/CpxP family protein refolding chaperone
MLRIIGATVLMLAMLGLAHSQEQADKNPEKAGTVRLPPFYKKLSLGEEQQKKIIKIRTESKKRIDSLRAEIERLRQKERTDCEAVLTPQQLKHLKELRIGETSSSLEKPKE